MRSKRVFEKTISEHTSISRIEIRLVSVLFIFVVEYALFQTKLFSCDFEFFNRSKGLIALAFIYFHHLSYILHNRVAKIRR